MAGSVEATPPAGEPPAAGPRIGVLAIQGDFEAHAGALRRLGAAVVEVRRPDQLEDLQGLIIPGGESTTMTKGLASYGFEEPLRDLIARGRPVFGTCAGLILLDRAHLGAMDILARRNAFGRQVRSFEADVRVQGLGDEPLRAVFIRAPWIEDHGDGVEVLAVVDDHPVVAREGNMLVAAFHPELTDDLRLHALFLAMTGREEGRKKGGAAASSRTASWQDEGR